VASKGSDAGGGGEGEVEDELIEIENAFYEGEDIIKENPEGAVEIFNKVIQLVSGRGAIKWTFKALQHLVILYYKLKQYQNTTQCYRNMLVHMGTVTRNECTDAINAILDAIATATDVEALSTVCEPM